MSGLNLIQSYISESEESADEDKPETKDASISKPLGIRLPIPESILSLKGAKHHDTVSDDPNLHDGRQRSFKHERGNWATLVYVDYLGNDGLNPWLKQVSDTLLPREHSMKSFSEFHLSLTKCLILKFHWIESFAESIRLLCKNTDKILVELSDLKIYCNEERTRTFIGIRCQDGSKSLKNFVKNIDKILDEYKLPLFYKEASFHISVMWCLGDAEKTLISELPKLNESLDKIFAEDITLRFIQIDNIICKIGNKIYTFSLK